MATLENRMMNYENSYKHKMTRTLPTFARLDGNNFSKFTKDLKKPFDKRFSELMIEVTKYLVEISGDITGYTVSDEITLMWYTENYDTDIYFNGKDYKIISSLSAKASVKFNQLLPLYLPEKVDETPSFDCRCWTVPTKEEAINVFIWREENGTRNSIFMLGREHFSHNDLNRRTTNTIKHMLYEVFDIDWDKYDASFKRGTYIKKKEIDKLINNEYKQGVVKRNIITTLDILPILEISNRQELIFSKKL